MKDEKWIPYKKGDEIPSEGIYLVTLDVRKVGKVTTLANVVRSWTKNNLMWGCPHKVIAYQRGPDYFGVDSDIKWQEIGKGAEPVLDKTYLVTIELKYEDGARRVTVMSYSYHPLHKKTIWADDFHKVIAFAELPEPFGNI